MYRKFKIVKTDSKYCDYLRNFDEKVTYNAFDKKLKPFLAYYLLLVNMSILHHYQVQKKNI